MKFPKAIKVKINTTPNYQIHNILAYAFNQKITSGLGDCAWRIFYYAYSMFRGLRNPQDNNYPAQDEWFKFYAYLEPKAADGKFGWPEAPAGEATGPNVANPFMAWIFGNNSKVTMANGVKDDTKDRIFGYWSEPIRLGGLEIKVPRKMPSKNYGDPNLSVAWSDAQIQRGCAAFIQDFKYLPRNSQTPSSKELELVSLGICAAARRHLKYIMETESMGRYAPSYVPDQDGKGGVFRKKSAVKDQIEQAIYYYLSYFRGTEDERAKHNYLGKDIRRNGFDFETFFSRQFLLAPNYSKPRYVIKENGQVKKDALGNSVVKYDTIGYPELFPEGPLSFYVNLPILSTNQSTVLSPAQLKNICTFQGTDENNKVITEFNTNPYPEINKNRFCLSAIFIQTSDIACLNGDPDGESQLLKNVFLDVYVNNKIYQSIPIKQEDKYSINNRTGLINNINSGFIQGVNQYKIYQFNKIHYFKYPVKGNISFKIRGSEGEPFPSYLSPGGINVGVKIQKKNNDNTISDVLSNFSMFIKFAHVIDMKPSAADAYVMMRVATTEGAGKDAGQMDPVGHYKTDKAKTIFNNYIKFGVAYNYTDKTLYQNDSYVSANPIYESVRKFISSNIKMADRTTLVDYEIDSDGNSVLYFNRFAMGMKKTGLDIFRGLGPSIDPVGNRNIRGAAAEEFVPIIKGKYYIVLDSDKNTNTFIKYIDGTTVRELKHGATFKGGDYYYVSYHDSSTIGVYELEGITGPEYVNTQKKSEIYVDGKKQVSPGTATNEWCMFMSYNLYHWSNSSPWKPEMYGDIMGALNGRCLTNSSVLEYYARSSKNVKRHLAQVSARSSSIPLVVEAPSGYNFTESANLKVQYLDWLNEDDIPQLFARSCSIYQPPYVIKSVTRANNYDPKSDVLKVTLQGRLMWNASQNFTGRVSELLEYAGRIFLGAEGSYSRTDENAVVHYLLHTLSGQSCPRNVVGDVSLDNQNFWANQRPFGCCYPRFYFIKMIPRVSSFTTMYSDHYRQMEFYLRAMCTGFINRKSEMTPDEVKSVISQGLTGLNMVGGYDSAIGDYIFEDLMAISYDNPEVIPLPPNMVGTG